MIPGRTTVAILAIMMTAVARDAAVEEVDAITTIAGTMIAEIVVTAVATTMTAEGVAEIVEVTGATMIVEETVEDVITIGVTECSS